MTRVLFRWLCALTGHYRNRFRLDGPGHVWRGPCVFCGVPSREYQDGKLIAIDNVSVNNRLVNSGLGDGRVGGGKPLIHEATRAPRKAKKSMKKTQRTKETKCQ